MYYNLRCIHPTGVHLKCHDAFHILHSPVIESGTSNQASVTVCGSVYINPLSKSVDFGERGFLCSKNKFLVILHKISDVRDYSPIMWVKKGRNSAFQYAYIFCWRTFACANYWFLRRNSKIRLRPLSDISGLA